MADWGTFEHQRPDLATAGRDLLYQFGVGLAFLATVASDGSPRVHPVCPVVTGRGLFVLVIPSPKRRDLHRDGRFAMHSYPREDDEDVFYLTGVALPERDPATDLEVRRAFLAERPAVTEADLAEQEVFWFDIERCLLTRTTGHGDPRPRHTVWRASEHT